MSTTERGRGAAELPLDSLGMFAAARSVPQATEAAILAAQDAALPDQRDVRAAVLVGEGSGRWAAEVVAAFCAPSAQVPVLVAAPGARPVFADESTLVVEIVATPSSGADAAVSPALVIGDALVPLGITVPHARAALGALPAAALVVLQRAGVADGVDRALDHAIVQLHRRRDELLPDGARADTAARKLARRIGRLFPAVYGEGDVGRLAARRWKQQCNVNAKAPAFCGALPDVFHDEVAGFGQHGDVTRQVLCAVLLRHDHESSRADAQFAALDEILVESMAAVHEVRAAGEGTLAQLLDLAYVGDVVSLELAAQEGLDPGPAPALQQP